MRQTIALYFLVLPTIVFANPTARVLDLCLDVTETPSTRIAALEAEGWTETGNALGALTVALTLPRINAGDPTNWNTDRDIAREIAVKAIDNADTVFLSAPNAEAVVFIGRDWRRLQTCLYLGPDDIGPVAEALDGAFLRIIDHVKRVRGDGIKSLISAHSITDEGRGLFDPALAYGMSFSVRLDRQPGD